tara:strand:- start:1891 stop:2118 length:228 start_codon:yes stop_codon:yes gene_type:complete
MEEISNIPILLNLLINGMITVFFVLFLVYILGKLIIYFFDSETVSEGSELEGIINKKIKDMAGDNAEVVSFRKLD